MSKKNDIYEVIQTRSPQKSKKLQRQGWELVGIDRSIVRGNQHNLRRLKQRDMTTSVELPGERSDLQLVLDLKSQRKLLKTVEKKLDRRNGDEKLAEMALNIRDNIRKIEDKLGVS